MKRSPKGEKLYVAAMEKSASDKTRIFPFIRGGVVIDMGAGAGALTQLLHHQYPEKRIVAVDAAPEMITLLEKRFKGEKLVEVVKADAQDFTYKQKVGSILFVSVLHEIFSFGNYSHRAVITTLKNAYNLLEPGGRLIIRDGVQPEQETLYLKPLHQDAYAKFHKFIESFRVRPIVFTKGYFRNDSFIQLNPKNFKEFEKEGALIEMHSQDLSELLSKYFYAETNWQVELTEQFGIWTLREYQHVLLDLGFFVSYTETYVLPYLLKTHYQKDFDVLKLENGRLAKDHYPPSTMILVAEKP